MKSSMSDAASAACVSSRTGTLRRIHTLLAAGGLFISKTPCLGDMNPLIRLILLPAMRTIGKAPYAGTFSAIDLSQNLSAAGFEILATESHSAHDANKRPYIVARKGKHLIPGTFRV